MFRFVSKNNRNNLVVFIHGFTGAEETWVNEEGKSFAEMLLNFEEIQLNYDFAEVIYYSKIMDFQKTKSASKFIKNLFKRSTKAVKKNVEINELAKFVRSLIHYNCESYENIIVIAHSMGGLVAKALVIDEIKNASTKKVKKYISLAVPHSGSNFAVIAGSIFTNPQVIDLEPLSEAVKSLNEDWLRLQDALPSSLYIYGQYDTIVPKTSAVPIGIGDDCIVPCDEDHNSITKPLAADRLCFLAVKKELESFYKQEKIETSLEIREFQDTGQLDNEIFVLKLLLAQVHNVLVYDAKQTFFNAEFMQKVLVARGIGVGELESLYARIRSIYALAFGKLLSGEIKSSDELVTEVHKNIKKEDREALSCSISAITYYQKTGMLHQLANRYDKEIQWAIKQGPAEVEEYRRMRKNE
ncbi:ABC-three component system protein [Bacillus tropicus]|uniref:ABC-three component system protein n=1 Tax=Bacillus tropicus TaxID=2026188 RepID=UPI003D1B865D